jgi:hypothetical protein
MLLPLAQSKTLLYALGAMLLFSTMAAAEIPGLCNTGQTHVAPTGCTSVLVPPNPTGGGPNRDGNWSLAYPYPSPLTSPDSPCELKGFVPAWVDTPNPAWLPKSASIASEWITPYHGEGNLAPGWYVYATKFLVPFALPGGTVPTGVTISGHLASDNSTYGIYIVNPAAGLCSPARYLPVPINPVDSFGVWTDFSFTNPIAITPGSPLLLYFVVQNAPNPAPEQDTPTGLRVEFFSTSSIF